MQLANEKQLQQIMVSRSQMPVQLGALWSSKQVVLVKQL
jgi:hypothetical protein